MQFPFPKGGSRLLPDIFLGNRGTMSVPPGAVVTSTDARYVIAPANDEIKEGIEVQ